MYLHSYGNCGNGIERERERTIVNQWARQRRKFLRWSHTNPADCARNSLTGKWSLFLMWHSVYFSISLDCAHSELHGDPKYCFIQKSMQFLRYLGRKWQKLLDQRQVTQDTLKVSLCLTLFTINALFYSNFNFYLLYLYSVSKIRKNVEKG